MSFNLKESIEQDMIEIKKLSPLDYLIYKEKNKRCYTQK